MDFSRFCPIEDYALVGDSRSAALVSRSGSIDWLCWPRFDSPALFAGLLDPEKGGYCRIRPASSFEADRRYEDDSNVLLTTFRNETGAARLTDLFYATSQDTKRSRLLPGAMLIRRLECTEGSLEAEVEVAPRADFGAAPASLRRRGSGSWTLPFGGGLVHVACSAPLLEDGGTLGARVSLAKGEALDLVVSYNGEGPAVYPSMGAIPQLIDETVRYWQAWCEGITYSGPHRQDVVRSALTLKLLTYAPSGAVVAAPTTSLPERIGAPYNWDYRFCWLRDASDTVFALLGLGLRAEANAFMQWLLHATRLTHPKLQVMYTVLGKPALAEKELPHLSGYMDSRPVRTGNAAHEQLQLDVYGEVIRASAIAYEGGMTLSGDEKSFLKGLAGFVLDNWRLPDSGIWESRGPPRHYVHSKVLCWVALDRVRRLAEAGHLDFDMGRLQSAVDEIAATVRQRGFNESIGSYTATLDGSDLDAAVLSMAIDGFEDADEPRMASTIRTVARELSRDGLVLRHLEEETAGEGAFLLCSFWLVQCLCLQGEVEQATRLFERLCAAANDVGLYSEEMDPATGRFLGNFPQAFTHIGLINAALALEKAKRGVTARQDVP